MKKLCILFSKAPHGSASGREALDLAMLSASFDFETTLLFTDEGVLHLLGGQQPELIGCRDYIATFKALEFYDIERLLVCETSLVERGLEGHPFPLELEILSPAQIANHLNEVDEVMVF
ncbi:sulfurtransferase complex subunit TusC [Shewanella sp. JM162201]|uniref:Sulfurtransferase complex subunit TusC n=1 Tax=Shewanella jiangmenensis TaxID=2837387 RepID=A0ABS5V6C2_9GAMM|nr:sulfurtransferase complex subunit TusC [Shewanella jiangmenensis]MBT1445445.1 sulfurtransferase complex subunit TusC [Shewanella jiangmenensis]